MTAELLSRGVPVLKPAYDNEPYDLVIELDGQFHRIQIKTAYRDSESTVCFETVSTKAKSDGYRRDDYAGDADLFGVYAPVPDEVYAVPVSRASRGKMVIRHDEPDNGQQTGINWREDYLLDEILQELDPDPVI